MSAGMEAKPQINQDAVRLMKQLHGTYGFRKQRNPLYKLSLCCKPFHGIRTVTVSP